jgi:penicillin amidase
MEGTPMRTPWLWIAFAVVWASHSLAEQNSKPQASTTTMRLPELHGPARVMRDVDGIWHLYAIDEHDALFLQGWFHAEDRLFQLDTLRRTASGTLAELVGRMRWRAMFS